MFPKDFARGNFALPNLVVVDLGDQDATARQNLSVARAIELVEGPANLAVVADLPDLAAVHLANQRQIEERRRFVDLGQVDARLVVLPPRGPFSMSLLCSPGGQWCGWPFSLGFPAQQKCPRLAVSISGGLARRKSISTGIGHVAPPTDPEPCGREPTATHRRARIASLPPLFVVQAAAATNAAAPRRAAPFLQCCQYSLACPSLSQAHARKRLEAFFFDAFIVRKGMKPQQHVDHATGCLRTNCRIARWPAKARDCR